MKINRFKPFYGVPYNFPVLPDSSNIMELVLTDPGALKNEQHDPGIYDESGDYVPMYSDSPDDVSGLFTPNQEESVGGTAGPENAEQDSSESVKPVSD